MSAEYTIRDAGRADLDAIVAFTLREAHEAEGVAADPNAVRRGVGAAFTEPPAAAYWVAEDSGCRVVGSISVVKEWSDFHGGHYWWIQSVYVIPERRGSGLIEALLNHVAAVARAAGALDLRLYAHQSNERALRAYRRCGFTPAPYVIMRREL